jgi:hypothetical protein
MLFRSCTVLTLLAVANSRSEAERRLACYPYTAVAAVHRPAVGAAAGAVVLAASAAVVGHAAALPSCCWDWEEARELKQKFNIIICCNLANQVYFTNIFPNFPPNDMSRYLAQM